MDELCPVEVIAALKVKLKSFERSFEVQYGRKAEHKDLAPETREMYARYKTLRRSSAAAELANAVRDQPPTDPPEPPEPPHSMTSHASSSVSNVRVKRSKSQQPLNTLGASRSLIKRGELAADSLSTVALVELMAAQLPPCPACSMYTRGQLPCVRSPPPQKRVFPWRLVWTRLRCERRQRLHRRSKAGTCVPQRPQTRRSRHTRRQLRERHVQRRASRRE